MVGSIPYAAATDDSYGGLQMLDPLGLSRSARAVGVVLVLIGVGGCTSGEPEPASSSSSSAATPSPSETSTPPSPEETAEEALAVAVSAYYAMQDTLLSDPASDLDLAVNVSQGAAADWLRTQAIDFRDQDLRQTGTVAPRVQQVQSLALGDGSAEATAEVLVCVDVSGTDALNAAGASVVTPERATRSTQTIGMVSREGAPEGPWFADTVSTDAGSPC